MKAKRKAVRGDFKAEIIRMHGNVCCNCGSDKDIEWHHIVPIEIGGNDVPSNIVPLCYDCHKAVTHNQLLIATAGRKHDKGGRKRKVPDNYEQILEDFFTCKVGKLETAKRLGWENNLKFTDSEWFKEFKDKHGIVKYRNNIDIKMKKAGNANGMCGYIKYKDGTIRICDNGKDDTKYSRYTKKRYAEIIKVSGEKHEPITADQD